MIQSVRPFPALFLQSVSSRLVSLSSVDLAIIAIYFVAVLGIGFYLKRYTKTGEDFFLAGPRDDRLGRGPELSSPPTSALWN